MHPRLPLLIGGRYQASMIGLSAQDWYSKASTASQTGDLVGALSAIRSGLKAYPKEAFLWHAGGSVLLMQGRPVEAAEHFGKAFKLEPKQFDHAVDQAIALNAAGHIREAHAVLRKIEKKGSKYAHYCSTRANAERALSNLADAAKWYDRALRIEPGRPKALVGRADVAMERGEPKALERFDRALELDQGNPALWLGKAQALDHLGDHDGAITIMEQVIEQAPGFTEAHRWLAQLRHTRGDADFASHFASAAKKAPQDPNIPDMWAKTLAGFGHDAQAADVAANARKRSKAESHFAMLEAVYAGAAGDHDRAEAIFASLDDSSLNRLTHEARHRIRRAEFETAENLLDQALERTPGDIGAWALLDMLWRLTDNPRAHWLHGQEGLIQMRKLECNDRLVDQAVAELRGLHEGAGQPLGQSVRGGTQTRGRLLDRTEKVFTELRRAIWRTLDAYRKELPPADPAHPLLTHRDAPWQLQGSWSVRLTGGGSHHASHIHPNGIISSALYLVVPDEAQDDAATEGWLELGSPPVDLSLDLQPLTRIKPEPGHLALFPSTLYHGTSPFGASDASERMTAVFDVVLSR